MEVDLRKRADRAQKLFYNLVDEYDKDEFDAAIKRADNDFSYLEPYWKNLILKAEALEAEIGRMPYEKRRAYIKELFEEQKMRREKVWEKGLSQEYKDLLAKIRKESNREE